jgi:hypothetical protein
VLLNLCGTTKRGVGIFCAKDLCCSWPTTLKVIQDLLAEKVSDLRASLADCKGRHNVFVLTVINNYVALMWPKHLVADRDSADDCGYPG